MTDKDEGDNHVRFSGLGLDMDKDEEVAAILELNASSSSTRKLESPPPPPEVVERLSPIPNPSRAESDEDVPPDRNGEAFHEGGGNAEHVNGNSVGRVSFTAPAIAEIHIIEEPAHVHFAESIPDDDGSVEQEIVHRKLDSPPPTPEVLESLSPVPSGSSSENLSLIMLPFEGEATKSGHVCFAPRLEVVEPTHEELSVHFSQPKPDDTLNHDGPHRNIESPPPPPEVVDLIKSAIPDDEKTSSDGVVEKEQLQPPELNDFEDDGAPHVRFSASPQVVEFIQVEHAHVHFSDPAVDDATTDSEGDRSRKLESPPPPLEAVRLSPTPDDLKNKEVLLLPIDEKDKSDGNGPHVHFSVAPQVVESIDPFHVHFSNPVSNVTLEHVVPLRKLESPPPPPEIEEVLSSKSSFLDESDVTPAIVDKADGHVHFSPKQQVVEIDQPENIRVSFSSPSMDDNLDHDGPHSRLESPPPPSDELRHSPLLRQGDKRDQTKAAAAAVEIWPATSRVVKFEQCNPEVISRDNLSSSLISDASVDENPEVSLTSTSTPDVTNSGRSSASSMRSGVRRFASKELRGNLTRRQIDRNPLEYYEIVDVLGEGSMGSVAKVRKRFSSTGAKSRQTAVEPTTETTTNRCFNLPLVGGLFRYCLKGSREDAITEPKEVRRSVSASFDELDLHASSQIMYAMKSIHLSRCTDQTLVDELKNEVEMLKTLDHPHIVRAMETFEYKNQLFVTMELCSGGDLYTHDPYTEEEAARITMAILSAVSYMHSKGISHRDLKYENILFVNESPLAEIKLIDFGLSQRFGKEELTDGVGTIYTMAPEVLKGAYSKNADLWSIGVIAYMLLSSQMPFYGRNRKQIIEQILRGTYEYKGRRWKRISKQGKAFIDDLLVVDPDDRATSDEAMKASWLNRRFGATVRSPHFEEIESVKNCIVKYADYSKLKKVALMVIAHKSTAAEIGILRKFFQQYDTAGIGHLNYDQFKSAISAVGYTEQDYRKIFEAVDIDGTEKIRYTEFLAATIEAQGALGEDKLEEAFDRLDSDGTGYITADNLAEMLGNEITRQEIDAIVAESAISNDGRISFEAFMRLWEDPHDEPNHYEIFRDIMIGDGKMDSERSANLSGISSDDDLPIRPHATIGEQDVSKQSVSSSENRKRVSFNAPEM